MPESGTPGTDDGDWEECVLWGRLLAAYIDLVSAPPEADEDRDA